MYNINIKENILKKYLRHLWKITFIVIIISSFTTCVNKTEPLPADAFYGTWVSQIDTHETNGKWQMYITRSAFQINIIGGENAGHIYFNINNCTLVENPRSVDDINKHFSNFRYGYKMDGRITSSTWYWNEDNYFIIYIYMHKNGNRFVISYPEDIPPDYPLVFYKSNFKQKERSILHSLFGILLYLVLILPFLIFFSDKTKENIQRMLIFSFCWISINIMMYLPIWFPVLNLLRGLTWSTSWCGYTYGIIWGILCYILFKRYFLENNFFTFKIEKTNIKYIIIFSITAILFQSILALFYLPSTYFNLEWLLYLLTISGIYQEILYSGILLGIMVSCLKENKFIHKNYISVILLSILFGIWHALLFQIDFELNFGIIRFFSTAIMGCLFYLITIKSKSIIPAIIVHNLSNVILTLIQMLK